MDAIPQAALQYRAAIVREAAFRFGVPAPAPVIAGQITQESAWRADARSRVGAAGLMQFMPRTAEWASPMCSGGAADALNPSWAIRCGVWYDRWLWERVAGKTDCDRWQFALAGFNGGLGYVQRRKARSPDPGSAAVTMPINPGIAPENQRENERYAPAIVYRWQPRFASWGRTVCL